jgi:hypothetical protein
VTNQIAEGKPFPEDLKEFRASLLPPEPVPEPKPEAGGKGKISAI